MLCIAGKDFFTFQFKFAANIIVRVHNTLYYVVNDFLISKYTVQRSGVKVHITSFLTTILDA